MTPRDVLGRAEGLGFHLSLRPGGLRLTGATEPPPDLLGLIAEHRPALLALLALLEEHAEARAAHDASLAADRVTTFPDYLAALVHPATLRACRADEAERDARRRAAQDALKGPRRVPLLPYQTRSNPRRC